MFQFLPTCLVGQLQIVFRDLVLQYYFLLLLITACVCVHHNAKDPAKWESNPLPIQPTAFLFLPLLVSFSLPLHSPAPTCVLHLSPSVLLLFHKWPPPFSISFSHSNTPFFPALSLALSLAVSFAQQSQQGSNPLSSISGSKSKNFLHFLWCILHLSLSLYLSFSVSLSFSTNPCTPPPLSVARGLVIPSSFNVAVPVNPIY